MEDRFVRNLGALTEEECRRLGEKTLLLAGCGGLGGHLLELLLRAGVGRIVAADPERFEPTNLNRQILCTGDTLGRSKAEAAAERASALGLDGRVVPRALRLDEDNLPELLAGCDAVLDALDSAEDRRTLKRACEIWNEQNRAKFEKWELNRTSIPPHTGASAWLYRIFEHQAVCGEPKALENDRKVNALLRRQVAAGKCPKTIRHRAVIWNTPANNYANFNNWLLECWGVDSVCEMIDLHGTGLIDTSDRESMLRGIANMYQTSTMRAHTKGGSELMLDDLWEKTAAYNADMILMFDQISCKGVGAINGLFEEGARKRGIPMCRVRQDLMDPTSITRREMRGDVNVFMQTVMNETPLDPSLVDFDDDESW